MDDDDDSFLTYLCLPYRLRVPICRSSWKFFLYHGKFIFLLLVVLGLCTFLLYSYPRTG